MSLVDMRPLQEIAEVEFRDIVVDAIVHDLNEMRIILVISTMDMSQT